MARERRGANTAEPYDDELVTVTMIEPQYHADFGRLEPDDEVDMDPRMARRWVGLHLAEAEGITFEEAKTHGRVRKARPYVPPAESGPQANPQVAALQQQVAELTRLVQSQLGGEESQPKRRVAAEPHQTQAQARSAGRDKGAVEVPDPVGPTMTTEAKTFSEAAADAKAADAQADEKSKASAKDKDKE